MRCLRDSLLLVPLLVSELRHANLFLFLMLGSLMMASCTCASDSGPPTPKAAAAKAQSKARGDRAKRPEPVLPENPIIKSVRYAWAITPVAESDLASLQTEVVEALTAAKGEAPTVPEEMPKKWKCRIGTFFPVTHADGADATVRTYERQNTLDCGDDAEDTEKWEFTLRFNEVERSNSRDAPGTAPFHMLSRSEVTTSAGAASSFHRSFKVDTRGGKAKSGPFPHDAAWIAEQVGDDFTFSEDTHQVRSDRWAIAQAQLDGERIVVEYEQWVMHERRCSHRSRACGADHSQGCRPHPTEPARRRGRRGHG